jgi:acetyl-CoA carboxylase alpha subunit
MAIVVGPERSSRGIGIEEADAVTRAVGAVVSSRRRPRPPIVTFLFCRGHANELAEERAGLPAALAEALKSLVVARLVGHPLLCVLGGGAYGAAYLSLAAPSHRILAIRGTTVAPMAPKVLAAFRRLRGMRQASETPHDLAQLIPEIRLVESIVRLPRALNEEWTAATAAARAEVTRRAGLSIAAGR